MNKVLLSAFIAMFLAQFLKILINFLNENEWNPKLIFSSGGMPSSHSASVMALSFAVGFEEGFRSTLFAITFFFSLIVMYDAAGVRRAAGKQAEILNRILDDLYHGKTLSDEEERLKELIGHTPVEVFVGAILGIIVSLIVYEIF